ncbi:MAG TPA: CehA/McbA family metallohydrolase [Thermoplasmata archaeon]|nr:CehA/McbA family metallohydrolase [Thermoplasmata archaeon]
MSPGARLDLHLHSTYSPDSRLALASAAAAARAAGLHGFALTDHNTVAGHRALVELRPRFPELLLIPGVEVSTREGHLLAFGVDESPPRGRPIEETIGWVRAHGGEPVLAHPFRWTHGVGRAVGGRASVAAVEAWNGQNSARANMAAVRLASTRRLPTTGGSDAHTEAGIGRAYTVLPDPPSSVEAFLEAIRRGATVGEGRSLGILGQIGWSVRNAGLRLRRGLRAI